MASDEAVLVKRNKSQVIKKSRNYSKLAFTHGDINRRRYKFCSKTFADDRLLELFNHVIYWITQSGILIIAKYSIINPFHSNLIRRADECEEGQINMVNCLKEELKIEMGVPSDVSGDASFVALEAACKRY
jgi:4-hydroxythreonine-4-phosphate dehydrogenase